MQKPDESGKTESRTWRWRCWHQLHCFGRFLQRAWTRRCAQAEALASPNCALAALELGSNDVCAAGVGALAARDATISRLGLC